MADQGRIDGRTKLLGLLATPIGHSLSPAMHNMSLRKLGLNYVYMAFEVGNEDGKLIGHITDGTGYMRGLKEAGVDVVGKKMVLMGAGGAATAIAIQAALDGVAEIAIFNRDDEYFARAEKNAHIINEEMKDVNCKATVHKLEDLDALKAAIVEADMSAVKQLMA